MNAFVFCLLFCLAAYFVGAIPFGFIIGKARGVDVRTVGSKNIGATNVYRTVGHGWGLLAFFCDFLKGLLPVLAAKGALAHFDAMASCVYLPLVVGVMAVVGHMFTCFMKFKGGKGVATGFGMLVALLPGLVLAAFGLFVVTVWLSHYISLGSIVAASFMAVTVWIPCHFIGNPAGYANGPQCLIVTLVGLFAVWKHRANIARLRTGTENKIY